MRTKLHSLLALTYCTASCYSLRLPLHLGSDDIRFSSLESRVDPSNSQIASLSNFRYVTNITLNGECTMPPGSPLMVILDSGSSDLWVNPPGGISGGKLEITGINKTLNFEGGENVNADIGFAPLEFVGHSVEQQGFLNVLSGKVSGYNDGQILGTLGLGFTTDDLIASGINTVLENIFRQSPKLLPFFVFDLARLDLHFGDRGYGGVNAITYESGGYLTLGEYEDHYKDIASAPYIPLFRAPEGTGGQRWAIPFDGVIVNGEDFTHNSNVIGAPTGKLIHVMDTGTPDVSLPSELFAQIYSAFPGVAQFPISGNDTETILPCNSTTPVEFVYGGQSFSVHPIDLVSSTLLIDSEGAKFIICKPAFTIDDDSGNRGRGFDNLIGTSFLRSVYIAYNFGDATVSGEASIQLLSKTTYDEALKEHAAWHSQLLTDMKAANVLDFYQHVVAPVLASESQSGKNKTSATLGYEPAETPIKTGSTLSVDAADLEGSSSLDDSLFKKYGPAMIGLLAGNILIGLILVALGVANYMKSGVRPETRNVGPTYTPLRLKEESSSAAYRTPYSDNRQLYSS